MTSTISDRLRMYVLCENLADIMFHGRLGAILSRTHVTDWACVVYHIHSAIAAHSDWWWINRRNAGKANVSGWVEHAKSLFRSLSLSIALRSFSHQEFHQHRGKCTLLCCRCRCRSFASPRNEFNVMIIATINNLNNERWIFLFSYK